MRVALTLDSSLPSLKTTAKRAEALGFERVYVGELWGGDAFVRLSSVAETTSRLTLGTGIVNVFSRTPAVLAMASHTMAQLAPAGFVLGVGASTPTAIEETHGMAYERPVRRVHETVEAVQRLLSGEGRVSYDGELVTVTDVPAIDADIPIYNAAIGSANRRVTGRLCDGWMPHNVPFPELESAFAEVATAARERDRDPDDITVSPWVPTVTHGDEETAKDYIRKHLAYYAGNSRGYRNAIGTAFPTAAKAIHDAWQDGNSGRATDLVTDEMIAELSVAGTPEMVREQLSDLVSSHLVDVPSLVLPNAAPDSATTRTMEAVAPLL